MDRETKILRLIVLAVFLGAVGLALHSARTAFVAHAHGLALSTQVVALVLVLFFVTCAVFPGWLGYLMFFRFLIRIEVTGGGYALLTRALQPVQAMQLSVVRKVGGLEGPNELTVVRADGKYWVCFSVALAMLNATPNGGSRAVNPEF